MIGTTKTPLKPKITLKQGVGVVLIACAFLILIALGVWQTQRLVWKEDQIKQAQTRPSMPVLSMNDIKQLQHDKGSLPYRRARLMGTFNNSKTIRVFTVLSNPKGRYAGPGYFIITPFELAGEELIILVNRGFVPQEMAQQNFLIKEDVQTIEGLIRPDDKADWITPEPDLEQRLFFKRDIAQIAQVMQLEKPLLPVTLDLETQKTSLPQAGETKISFPNRHLGYALTWFGLAACLVVLFIRANPSSNRSDLMKKGERQQKDI